MINPSARTKTVLPNIRGSGCSYKNDGVGPSSVPCENRARQQRGTERYDSKGFNDNTDYGFLSIDDDSFENFLKNDNFEEEEEDIANDILMQLGNPLDNLRTEGNSMFNFRSEYGNMSKPLKLHTNLKEEISDTGLHRQTKDETRCIKKADGDKLGSSSNTNESAGYGMPRRSNYDKRNAF